MLGFPYELKGGGFLPIWKRASIASEPEIDQDGLPKLYIDTASRPGMSGAPVIYKQKRNMAVGEGPPGSTTKFSAYLTMLVGIYSGRYTSLDPLDAQLGIVWKSKAIDEIIDTIVKKESA